MTKLLAVNITFFEETYYKRWRLLANDYNMDVTLVGPKYFEYHFAGPTMKFRPSEVEENHFRVRHIDMSSKKWLRNDWLSSDYVKLVKSIRPDFIYLIGYETKNIVFLTALARKLFIPKAKIVLFTMRGIDMPLHGLEFRTRWKYSKKIFDAVFCHYPHGKTIIKQQGKYNGPVYLQTQIGVDAHIYKPNTVDRASIRDQYNIKENEYVFGSAIRIEKAKGVYDIIEACKKLNIPFKYLLLGNGKEFDDVLKTIQENGLKDKIILTGGIQGRENVAAHMNGMDCFIHIPKTTKFWVDTFPLAVVQAMATGLPVIGSDSGAVPYQLGECGMIIPEGNVEALHDKMFYCMNQPNKTKLLGSVMRKRVMGTFEIRHLNECFYITVLAIINDSFADNCKDQVTFHIAD